MPKGGNNPRAYTGFRPEGLICIYCGRRVADGNGLAFRGCVCGSGLRPSGGGLTKEAADETRDILNHERDRQKMIDSLLPSTDFRRK